MVKRSRPPGLELHRTHHSAKQLILPLPRQMHSHGIGKMLWTWPITLKIDFDSRGDFSLKHVTSSCRHAIGGYSRAIQQSKMAALASQPVVHWFYDCNTRLDCGVCKRKLGLIPAMICIQNDSVHRSNNISGMFQHVSARVARPGSRKRIEGTQQQ